MVRIPGISRPENKQIQLSIAESYNLWDILAAKYFALERLNIFKVYAHDPDLKYLLNLDLEDLKKDVRILEKAMEEYGVKGPNNHVLEPTSAINMEIFRDQFIAGELFLFLQENVEMLLRALRTTTTNDSLRGIFTSLVKDAIKRADRTAEYLKLRGWTGVPPMYKNIPTNAENIDDGEAFQLWNQLTYRYDNAYQTLLFSSMAFDTDFRFLLNQGHKLLMGQVKRLEKELKRYGIPLPVRPPTVAPPSTDTAILNDDYMFRTIIDGMQGALVFQAQGLKQSVTNQRVRGILKDLLLEELETYGDMIKFGKLKGWLNPVPNAGNRM